MLAGLSIRQPGTDIRAISSALIWKYAKSEFIRNLI